MNSKEPRYCFAVMWNNWYGRKQERELKLYSDHLERIDPTTQSTRKSWPYDALTRVAHNQRECALALTFQDGTVEHYQSQLTGLLNALVDALQALAPHVELVQVMS
jgi:hypothetical protein